MAVDKNAEAMLQAADCAWRASRASAVISYAGRATEALNTRPKREGVSDAEWASEKSALLGTALFYIGVGNALECGMAPRTRRCEPRCRPSRATAQLYAIRLFYLGLANYQLGKPIGDRAQMRQGLAILPAIGRDREPACRIKRRRNAKLVLAELGGK